jgi:transketolase
MDGIFTLADAVRMSASREVYGKKLIELGKKHDNIVVMTADLMRSDHIEEYKRAYPERALSVGIAEQNLMSIAAGLALTGKIVFCSTMAPFATMRACEQVRTDIDYGRLQVRIIGSHSGLSSGSGPTHRAGGYRHHALSVQHDRHRTGDPNQIGKVVEASLDWPGPMYIRIGRGANPGSTRTTTNMRSGRPFPSATAATPPLSPAARCSGTPKSRGAPGGGRVQHSRHRHAHH